MRESWGIPVAAAATVLAALLMGCLPSVAESLTLRIHDAIGEPGGPIAIVLRTYASRPIGQGQVCLQAQPGPGDMPQPVESAEGAAVFSDADDAMSDLTATLETDPQQILLQFTSASATVNASDGPMAVVFLHLGSAVVPGQVYDLVLDLAGTSFVDENGQPVPIEPRDGTLTIRAPEDPILLEANAESTPPGGTALLSAVTFEPVPLSSGQVGIRYDTTVAAGAPIVAMDPRHGSAMFSASMPEPGLVVVAFQSPDGTLNGVPGDLVELYLPTAHDVPPGTVSPVTLDPDTTFFVDDQGQPVSLLLGNGALEFTAVQPGVVSQLAVEKLPGDSLRLSWAPDCASATEYSVYRGDLDQGYGSLSPEPGLCNVPDTEATVPRGPGTADFFLVVPHVDGEEGGYGWDSDGFPRLPAGSSCHPQTSPADCVP